MYFFKNLNSYGKVALFYFSFVEHTKVQSGADYTNRKVVS